MDDAKLTALPVLRDLEVKGRRVLIRVDMNVPVCSGRVVADQRIRAAVPTIELALAKGAAVILLSHLGRPKQGCRQAEFSLGPVGRRLSELLRKPVRFEQRYLNGITAAPGEVVLCENVRFNRGEESDDETLSRQLAALGDVFVMDAFATAHRAHASTHGIALHAPQSCAGLLLEREIQALRRVLEQPRRPVVAVIGGAKISNKFESLKALADRSDCLIPVGGIANVMYAARGYEIGKSLCEQGMSRQVEALRRTAARQGCEIYLAEDVVCAKALSCEAETVVRSIDAIEPEEMIGDAGPRSCAEFERIIDTAGTVLWSGPVGVFEKVPFAAGTRRLALAVAGSDAYTLAGGGDTVAAIEQFGVGDSLSYVSTGGGAFLEFISGKPLPALEALQARHRSPARTQPCSPDKDELRGVG